MRGAAAVLLSVPLSVVATARAETTIPWDQAEKHVGEVVTVEGRVMGVHCSPTSCLLAFDPSFNRFTALIQAGSFGTFPPAELEQQYSRKRVRVHGKVEQREKKPEITLVKSEDIEVVAEEGEEKRAAERASQDQAALLERLATLLARVEELAGRLAETQERMDATLAALEERAASLEVAQATQPAPPPPPSYGEPQPRPGFESLRTVKRGMSRADVERLVGQPLHVESTGTGWTTWYYGYGRSISFDARGRVRGLVGFPAP